MASGAKSLLLSSTKLSRIEQLLTPPQLIARRGRPASQCPPRTGGVPCGCVVFCSPSKPTRGRVQIAGSGNRAPLPPLAAALLRQVKTEADRRAVARDYRTPARPAKARIATTLELRRPLRFGRLGLAPAHCHSHYLGLAPVLRYRGSSAPEGLTGLCPHSGDTVNCVRPLVPNRTATRGRADCPSGDPAPLHPPRRGRAAPECRCRVSWTYCCSTPGPAGHRAGCTTPCSPRARQRRSCTSCHRLGSLGARTLARRDAVTALVCVGALVLGALLAG